MLDYEALKDYLKKNGLKQKYIAEKIGLTEGEICFTLSGKRNFTLNEYIQLCRFLDVSMDAFIILPARIRKGQE